MTGSGVGDSYAKLKAHLLQTTPGRVLFQMAMAANHQDRLNAVEDAIDWIAQEHTKTRQHRQERSEDALTIDIISDLKSMGFQASHDTQYGGHCDIVIEARDNFLWIAEAKIHSSYDWLVKGFAQLDERYSTGLPGQDAGEMLIYCYGERADRVMKEWGIRLRESRPDVEVTAPDDDPLVLRSTHVHKGTGATFRVRHKGVSLYFKPTV
ncbi:hypothetical protein [Mesorhizobium sp. L103C131B0]|uniref:hypothetical protein n=1 Tax=Mesorhizobium sp. L103C131B0 TaxID=1287089 RepID=UPI0003CFA6BF|nr:hypothetical protein [Mesorhizobium sp. L103C131B0]ESZ56513.1 hypothetical protein X729_24230 [Mesorhizobium sp. L103C131B0]